MPRTGDTARRGAGRAGWSRPPSERLRCGPGHEEWLRSPLVARRLAVGAEGVQARGGEGLRGHGRGGSVPGRTTTVCPSSGVVVPCFLCWYGGKCGECRPLSGERWVRTRKCLLVSPWPCPWVAKR